MLRNFKKHLPLEVSYLQCNHVGNLNFKVLESALTIKRFYPAVISNQNTPVFLSGSGEVLITLVENNLYAQETTKSSLVLKELFNWKFIGNITKPYCELLSAVGGTLETDTSKSETVGAINYVLHPNYPNLCTDDTIIELDLPCLQKHGLFFVMCLEGCSIPSGGITMQTGSTIRSNAKNSP